MNQFLIFQITIFWTVVFLTISAYSQNNFETLEPLTYEQELQYWDLGPSDEDEGARLPSWCVEYREWELEDGITIWARYVSDGKNTVILEDEFFNPIILKNSQLSKEDSILLKNIQKTKKKIPGKVKAHWDEKSAQEFIDSLCRKWELADGRIIEARWVSVEENSILLYDMFGKYIEVKTKELSKKDAKFQKELWHKQLRQDRKEKAKERKQR